MSAPTESEQRGDASNDRRWMRLTNSDRPLSEVAKAVWDGTADPDDYQIALGNQPQLQASLLDPTQNCLELSSDLIRPIEPPSDEL